MNRRPRPVLVLLTALIPLAVTAGGTFLVMHAGPRVIEGLSARNRFPPTKLSGCAVYCAILRRGEPLTLKLGLPIRRCHRSLRSHDRHR
jgi:hypothetical protein